jgi:hypothetical protein
MKIIKSIILLLLLNSCAQFVSEQNFDLVHPVKTLPRTKIYIIGLKGEDKFLLKNNWYNLIGRLELFDDFDLTIVDSEKDITVGNEKSILIQRKDSGAIIDAELLVASVFTLYLIPFWSNENRNIEIKIKDLNLNKSHSVSIAFKTLTIYHFIAVFFLISDDYNPLIIEKKATKKSFYLAFSKLEEK